MQAPTERNEIIFVPDAVVVGGSFYSRVTFPTHQRPRDSRHPDFYRPRIRIGLIVASVGTIVTTLGFWLAWWAQRSGDKDVENVVEGLAVCSLIVAVAGPVLAAIAWRLRQRQYRG